MSKQGRVMIMAGGTGGHVFPGLAVAERLRGQGVTVSWLGTRRGIEAELVPARGYELHYLDIEGVRGRGLSALIKAPVLLLRSIFQARARMKSFKPDVVLGMGGFASGPGAVAARLLGIPLVIHEQNSVAGTTNRIAAKMAKRVMQGFPDTLAKGEWCGNPVRPEITTLPAPYERFPQRSGAVRLLILGGSRGALAINQLLPEAIAMMDEKQRPVILHQAGAAHSEKTKELYQQAGVSAEVVPFIEKMDAAYRWADFVVCRAGALTIAELTSVGIGSLLIPFPFAIDDHQTANGKLLVEQGAALMFQQKDLSAERLASELAAICSDGDHRMGMAIRARRLAKDDAAEQVAQVCMEVCGGR